MRSRVAIFVMVLVFTLCIGVLSAAQQGGAQGQNQNVQITKGPVVENTTHNTAVIAWSTNVSANSVLKYGTDQNNLDQTAEVPWGGLTHRVALKNLQPSTTYYYQVQSAQGQGTGTGAMSNVSQFQTKPAPAGQGQQGQASGGAQPMTLAVVAGPIPQQITDNSVKLWWQTNQPVSGSVVKYGTSPSEMKQQAQSTSTDQQSHTAQLTGLQPNTQYYVSVVRSDGQVSTTGGFKTMPPNFASSGTVNITNGPVIEYLADNQAVISWSTSAPSSSVVKYGTDTNSLNQSAQAPWTSGTHRVTLKKLQPNTKYFFQIQSAQAKGTGTMASSGVYPFQTIASGQAAMNIKPQ